MSRRTSEANKAVAAAWANEKELVLDGKGTRNWTSEQQSQILDRGKVYDENGRALEGHHMKSVEAYPAYQADPGNIQFLSRDEHLDAHSGRTQNPTNGCYDPITGETVAFTEDTYEPCKIIELSEPIVQVEKIHTVEAENDLEKNHAESENNITNNQGRNDSASDSKHQNIKTSSTDISDAVRVSMKPKSSSARSKKSGLLDKIATGLGFETKGNMGRAFVRNIPKLLSVAAPIVVPIVFNRVLSSRNRRSTNQPKSVSTDRANIDLSEASNVINTVRSSPVKHMVKEHGQNYNTKTGVEWRNKAPYPRGNDANK